MNGLGFAARDFAQTLSGATRRRCELYALAHRLKQTHQSEQRSRLSATGSARDDACAVADRSYDRIQLLVRKFYLLLVAESRKPTLYTGPIDRYGMIEIE